MTTGEAGPDLSRWMVQQGQAIAFRRYSLGYVADEDRASEPRVALWAGEFQDPFRVPASDPTRASKRA